MSCRQVGMPWFPTPRTALSHGPNRRMRSSGRSCRRRSGTGPVRALWWTIGFAALLAIALVVALALWLGRIIARSVGHAARAAIALGEGGQVVPSGTPVAEVNTLMAELRRTAARRQA